MYPYLESVRANLAQQIKPLSERVPNIRIGVIAHGGAFPITFTTPTAWSA